MRRTTSALFVLVLALAGSWGTAAAEPGTDAPAPAMLTLTTMPNGWSSRLDLRPMLQVYADGRAVKRPDAAAADRPESTPPEQLTGTIPADVLNAALAETKSLAALDLGMPGVSDQGSQIIDLMPPQPDPAVHVIMYAPEFTDGLTTEQQDNRKRFTDLYRKLLDAFIQGH